MANIQLLPYAQQIAAIERQRKLADLLQQQGLEPSETQTAGRFVVPVSPLQSIAKLAQAGLGAYMENKAAQRESELETQQREEAKKSIQDFIAASGPQKQVTQVPLTKDITQAAGPEDYQDIMNQPLQTRDMAQAATPEDVQDIVNQPYVTKDVTSYTPGLSRNEQIAKLLEMQMGGNKYVSAAIPTLAGWLPKAAEEEEYGTPFESGGQMYTMSKSGNVKPLNLAAPTKQASLPSSVQEYEYAVKQGFKGSLADYEKMKAINVNVPAAETYGAMTTAIDPVTGQPIYVRGGSRGSIQRVEGYAPPPKAPTQEQVVAGTYANKIQDAEDVLGKFGAGSPYKPPSTKEQFKADIPFIGNQLIDEPTQTYKVAERAFIEAWLRKTSGAVISPSEFEQARKQYIPQPGDSDAVIEQKRQARQRVLQGMKQGAGQYYEDSEIPPGFNVVGGNQ